MEEVDVNYKEQYNENLSDMYRPNNNKNAKKDGGHCLSCYAIVKNKHKFCTSCGEKITRCANCSYVIHDYDNFCPYCGEVNEKNESDLHEYIEKYGKDEGILQHRLNSYCHNLGIRILPLLPLEVCTACRSSLGCVGNNKYIYCPHCGINLNYKNSKTVI